MSATKALTLSIVIPAYNEENHLKACLEAIAVQTVMPDEVIVVDNNSTDDTVKVAKSFPFVRVVTESRQGIVYARDAGFNAAKSVLIGRIDADTILPTDWVEYIEGYYVYGDNIATCLTGGCYFYNVRMPRLNGWLQGQIAFRMNRLLMGHYILYGANMVIPRDIWRDVKSSVCHRNDIHEDLDLGIHVHRARHEIAYREQLRVGVKMRRVRSDRRKLLANNLLWPQTLKSHGVKAWPLALFGAYIMFAAVPVIIVAEFFARLAGRNELPG